MSEYVLKCKNQKEALESLMLIYDLSEEEIIFIIKDHAFKEQGLLYQDMRGFAHSEYLQTNLGSAKFKSHYYHRTISNGDGGWFDDGLLPGRQGFKKIKTFFNKALPSICTHRAEQVVIMQNDLTEDDGPYAFAVYDEAVNADKKYLHDYYVPECFHDYTETEKNLIKKTTKAAIVTFLAEPKYPESYVNAIWEYLTTLNINDREPPLSYGACYSGEGKKIEKNQIVKIDYLNWNLTDYES